MISSSLQSECEDEVLFVVLVCRHLCYGWQSRHRLLTAKHRISSLQQIESEMVLKTCKKVKTCQEKANIWLRVSFDLYCIWMAGLTTNMNRHEEQVDTSTKADSFLSSWSVCCYCLMAGMFCVLLVVVPPACENGWFRDHRARSRVAAGQPGGPANILG